MYNKMEQLESKKEIITISKELDIKMELETEYVPVEKGIGIRFTTRLLPNEWIKYNDKGEIEQLKKL